MKLISHSVMEKSIITVYKKQRSIYPPICFMYDEKGGGPVLKTRKHKWTCISGLMLFIKNTNIFIQFRRWG